MAGGIDWFRWHHGSVTDPKFRLVAARSGATVAEVIAVWSCVLEAASMADPRGSAGAPDFEALDCALGMADGLSNAIFDAMVSRGLLSAGGEVLSWDRRQPKREREDDGAAERKRLQRERERAAAGVTVTTTEQVTPCHATSHQKTPRGEESREEPSSPTSKKVSTIARKSEKSAPTTLKVWLETARLNGEKPIPEGDPVFEYAEKVGLPEQFLFLAWRVFRSTYTVARAKKRYADWRMVFRNAVEGNWLKLWFLDPASNQYGLTTVGLQAKRAHEEKHAA